VVARLLARRTAKKAWATSMQWRSSQQQQQQQQQQHAAFLRLHGFSFGGRSQPGIELP
jgi:hypothetical protein